MAKNTIFKPTHKAIQQYYQSLKEYQEQGVKHEGAVETAFQQLLAKTARVHHCTLIPKQKLRVNKNNLFPDGTVRETLYDTRLGFWEAKDTDDDLDKEISAKIAKGYPLTNTIFEDTRRAVLFQGGQERYRFDLTDKKQLASLLNEFYAYTEPEIENFQQAVEEFKTRVPELAKGLVGKLDEAHRNNKKFQAAFESFLTVCQQTLNPNISRAAVDEMLVQHLLTERLIRKIFDNPEFMHRNVIAAEIEKVIDALVSLSFNRDQFLKSLDRFYRAIEDAAHTLEDFSEKQHFLNTVYERFFQGYSVKVADTHGIVYTPQEIVDFMCVRLPVIKFGRKSSIIRVDKTIYQCTVVTGIENGANYRCRIPTANMKSVAQSTASSSMATGKRTLLLSRLFNGCEEFGNSRGPIRFILGPCILDSNIHWV